MKILIITQAVDTENTTLGFFSGWLKEMSKKFESINVVCLHEGKHNLPENVSVHSLGKSASSADSPNRRSKINYVFNFYSYIWKYRNEYDAVFVHMNQEYILLGGLFWKIFGKKIFFWRNHPYGNILTQIAVALSDKVFCTSKASFTKQFKKTVLMPVGIDTDIFKPTENIQRIKNSICMVGRISPIKRIDLGLKAIKYLIDSGTQVSMSIVGSYLPKDEEYYLSLVSFVDENKLGSFVKFTKAVPGYELPEIYSNHEIYLNLTESGSFDKTIVESVACGAIPLVTNGSLSDLLPSVCITKNDVEYISQSLQSLLRHEVKLQIGSELDTFVKNNSLKNLMDRLVKEIIT